MITEDQRTLNHADDEAEELTRRNGRRMIRAGTTIIFAVITTALAGALAHEGRISHERMLLFIVAGLGCVAAGAILSGTGLAERLQRLLRGQMRAQRNDFTILAAELRESRRESEMLRADLQIVIRDVGGAVVQAKQNWDKIVELSGRADTWSSQQDAVIGLMGEIVKELPDLKDRIHWGGFNAAVREGFAPAQTGTHGPSNVRNLREVPPSNDPAARE